MKISVQSDIDHVMRQHGEDMRRAVEVAAQRAVVATAREVQRVAVAEMARAFDRPTRFTLNAFRVAQGGKEVIQSRYDGANPSVQRWSGWAPVAGSAISAEVVVKDGRYDRADHYLQTQIHGGNRKAKAFENALRSAGVLPAGWYAVPGAAAKLDAHGNHSAGEIRQILSWFDAAEVGAGSTQNMRDKGRDKRRKGTRRQRGFEYVAVIPGRWQRGRLHPGIYRRSFFGFGSAVQPVVIFVNAANYKPRFDFYGVAQRAVDNFFKPRLDLDLQRELDKVRT